MTPDQLEEAAKFAYEDFTKESWDALAKKHEWRDLITMVDNGLGNNPGNGPETAALKAYQTIVAAAPGSVDIGPLLVANELVAESVEPVGETEAADAAPAKKSGKSK